MCVCMCTNTVYILVDVLEMGCLTQSGGEYSTAHTLLVSNVRKL